MRTRTPGGAAVLATLIALNTNTACAESKAAWAPSWTAAVSRIENDALLSDNQLNDATLRQAVRLSIGGRRIRLVLSNSAGDQPLRISGVHVAMSGLPGAASIQPGSDREVRFGHRRSVTILSHGSAISDAVELPVPPLARLSISMHFASPPPRQTGHLRSLSTSWLAHGNRLGAPTLSLAVPVEHWYQLAAVQVEAPDPRVIVAFGDSITDGSRSTPNSNSRWPDFLAERLQSLPQTSAYAVVNEGIAGNQLLADGFGASALDRFERDVLSQPNAHAVVLLEGINDLGQFAHTLPQADARRAFMTRIVGAYQQLIARAHDHRLRIIGATLLPYMGSDYHPTSVDDIERRAINDWIRAPGHFDAVIDWDAVMSDPGDPDRLRPEFDSGDHIHPSAAGYRAMADAIPIAALVK